MKPLDALKRAIELAGGSSAVASRFNIKRQSVEGWEICPPTRVIGLEELTWGKVTRHQLRPDIYPREQMAPKEGQDGKKDRSRKDEQKGKGQGD